MRRLFTKVAERGKSLDLLSIQQEARIEEIGKKFSMHASFVEAP